jgi:hypothetical protein
MKKIYLLLVMGFFNIAMFSCTPNTNADNSPVSETSEECCGDDVPVNPPPTGD